MEAIVFFVCAAAALVGAGVNVAGLVVEPPHPVTRRAIARDRFIGMVMPHPIPTRYQSV